MKSFVLNGGLGRTMTAVVVTAMAATLTACGGGSGGGPVSTPAPPPAPTPVPTPTPTPTPTPAPSSNDTAEYRASLAAVSANALAAYDKGLTGKGVTIAVIDNGLKTSAPELAGRVSADSRSFASTYARCVTCAPETITYPVDAGGDGHGTTVTMIAAAARDGQRIHGVAPEATILALNIVGPDLNGIAGQPATFTPPPGGYEVNNIAQAIAYAVEKNAFAINMSLGFARSSSATIAAARLTAMDSVRTADRLVVQAAPNDPGQDAFAGTFDGVKDLLGADVRNRDWYLLALGLGAGNTPVASGNGVPGALADRTLSVRAFNVQSVGLDGNVTTVSGNSYAAPAVAGAAALLKQLWPQLGGKAIARILLDTATDLGAPGADQQYGVGLLDLSKAVTAQAPTVATAMGFSVPVAGSTVTVSSAFGNAGQGFGSLVAVDRYGRDYAVNLSGSFAQDRGGFRIAAFAAPAVSLLTWTAPSSRDGAAMGLRDVDRDRNASLVRLPGRVALRLTGSTMVDLGVRGDTGGPLSNAGSGLMLAGDLGRGIGASRYGDGLTVSQGAGQAFVLQLSAARTAGPDGRRSATSTGIAVSHLSTGLRFGISRLDEATGVLGLTGRGALATAGASSLFAEIGWMGAVAGWSINGRVLAGRTTAVRVPTSLLRFDGTIASSGFSVSAQHPLGRGFASFGVVSPLRADRARLGGALPTGFDLTTGASTLTAFASDISAQAREIDVEVGYALPFTGGRFEFAGAQGFDAGNVAGRTSTAVIVRLAMIR